MAEDAGPSYTIKATDPFAIHGLISYARELEQNDYADSAEDVFNTAMEIAVWQRENPEKVHTTLPGKTGERNET